ncbi:MAG: DsbC family protein [Arenicella sp.]|nr:DsbC family protein [Arenicella sp.]
MKRTFFKVSTIASIIISIAVSFALTQSSYASDIESKIQGAFGDKPIVVSDYVDQLKEVLVDSKIYFTTHDGRYLFAGPIFDTERRTDIIELREDQLRQAYLSSLPQDVFVNYPSNVPSKHKITVFTDIDCPYCRTLHGHVANFNQRGISVNYIMLPRTGVGSESYKKTVAALCSDDPADSITQAMLNQAPAPNSCEPTRVSQHMEIASKLKINSTPTIVLPNGHIQLGLVNPDQLMALLGGTE